MRKSSATKLRQLVREGEGSGPPIPWDPKMMKKAARLRKALMAGLHSPDVDDFDIVKVVKRLKKRR
jgi:hypothetical protein